MEKKGVGRPRDGNPEETRHEILRAAGEAFADCGFVGATTRAVAARAGVNVATLHYHFGSKEGLYRAVLATAARGALPVVPPGPPGETIDRLVEALFTFGAEHPILARLSLLDTLAGPQSPGGPVPDGRVRWLAEALRGALPARGDEPASLAPEEAARSIVALVDATFVVASPSTPYAPREEGGESPPAAPPPLPPESARRAVVAAALRLTGLA